MCDQEFRTLRIDPRYPFTNQTNVSIPKPLKNQNVEDSKQGSMYEGNDLNVDEERFMACYDNYCDYHKCTRLLGDVDDCKIFKRYFETICPNYWISHWDELREKGAFPGAI